MPWAPERFQRTLPCLLEVMVNSLRWWRFRFLGDSHWALPHRVVVLWLVILPLEFRNELLNNRVSSQPESDFSLDFDEPLLEGLNLVHEEIWFRRETDADSRHFLRDIEYLIARVNQKRFDVDPQCWPDRAVKWRLARNFDFQVSQEYLHLLEFLLDSLELWQGFVKVRNAPFLVQRSLRLLIPERRCHLCRELAYNEFLNFK